MTDSIKKDTYSNIAVSNIELSDKDTRAILTPFAFKIDQSLFGLGLAKPYKRAIALLIDLLLIAVLSDAPGELLTIVIAVTLYRLGNKNVTGKSTSQQGIIKGHKRRALLRILGFFIIFIMLMDTLPTLFSSFSNKDHSNTIMALDENKDAGIKIHSVASAIELTAIGYSIKLLTEDSECKNYLCWSKELQQFFNQDISDEELSLNAQDMKKVMNRAVSKTNLTNQQKEQLTAQLFTQYSKNKAEHASVQRIKQVAQQDNKPIKNTGAYSIIAWAKGIINDLGLGFGWSAFYFTVLTALWHGQTLGKKVVGIKVLQLDGTPLTLWDSFGRYGGYGAGIATGLLGFIQIFWDANRQAIHDKISATVVIESKKNKKSQ